MATRVTTLWMRKRKTAGEKIVVLTAYDFPTAQLADEAGVDVLLVGDSVGNTVMGLPDTLGVTMDDMVRHTKMVSRAAKRAFIVADMPFLSFQTSLEEAVRNAGRFLSEAGAHGVKLETPLRAEQLETIRALTGIGIPVMGHIGLTPQSVHQFGGYRVQGRGADEQSRLVESAKRLEDAGCFAVVLECVPGGLASQVTEAVSIPTIGIGAGGACDGQVLVMHDILGWGATRFCKTYADVRGAMKQAFEGYAREVRTGEFPSKEQEYS